MPTTAVMSRFEYLAARASITPRKAVGLASSIDMSLNWRPCARESRVSTKIPTSQWLVQCGRLSRVSRGARESRAHVAQSAFCRHVPLLTRPIARAWSGNTGFGKLGTKRMDWMISAQTSSLIPPSAFTCRFGCVIGSLLGPRSCRMCRRLFWLALLPPQLQTSALQESTYDTFRAKYESIVPRFNFGDLKDVVRASSIEGKKSTFWLASSLAIEPWSSCNMMTRTCLAATAGGARGDT